MPFPRKIRAAVRPMVCGGQPGEGSFEKIGSGSGYIGFREAHSANSRQAASPQSIYAFQMPLISSKKWHCQTQLHPTSSCICSTSTLLGLQLNREDLQIFPEASS